MTTKDQLPPLPPAAVDEHNLQGGRLLYTRQQMHAYALAALAQQAQEPVALGLPIHNLRTMANGLRAVEVVNKRFIAARLDEIADYLRDLERATPPAPPVPAPVDERHRTVALELDRLMLVIESAVRWQDPTHHPAVLSLLKANRTALQSPAPQATKGQP